MTKDCCQVCVLPLRLSGVCMISGNLNTTWFDTDFTPTGHGATYGKWYEKIFFTFDFHILPEQWHIGARIIPCRCIKKKIPRWPIYLFTGNESKPPLKLSDCGRKIRNDVHTDTCYCKPKLVSWRKLNITVFYTRFLSPTDRKYADSSTYWKFLD